MFTEEKRESVQTNAVLMFTFLLISCENDFYFFLLDMKWSSYFICGSWCLEIVLSVLANVLSPSHDLHDLFVLSLSNG